MSAFEDLLDDVAEALRAEPFFALIDVHIDNGTTREDEDMFEDKIAASLLSAGAVIGIVFTDQNVSTYDADRPYVDPQIEIVVRYDPHFEKSDTRATLNDICEAIVNALHLFVPDNQGASITPKPQVWRITNEDGVLKARNFYETSAGTDYSKPSLGDLTLSLVAGVVTISDIPAGSAVFYTTNNDFPSPRLGTLYTTPVSVTSGTRFKARAWLAGYKGSKIASLTA